MDKVFISYSHDDTEFVERLETRLNEHTGIEAVYDKQVLEGGDDLIELFEEIGTSDAVICVLSPSSVDSAFVEKEISSAIIKEISESSFRFIPVIKEGSDFDTVMGKMGDGVQTVIKTYNIPRFDKDFDTAIDTVVSSFDGEIDSERIYHRATSEGTENPFARTRAENLKDDRVAAHLFAKPEPRRYDKIREVKPTVIEGARGTGKTMVLKSLQSNINMMIKNEDTLENADLNRFGVYLRASQGAFETQSEDVASKLDDDKMKVVSMSEFILRLTESLIDEIQNAKEEGHIQGNISEEKSLVEDLKIPLQLDGDVNTIDDVQSDIKKNLFKLQSYISNIIIDNNPSYDGVHLKKDNLAYVCEAVNSYLPGGDYTVYFLVDEYENLLDFQKEIVNTFIKWSESQIFTFKVASKKPCFNNPRTLEDQELEEPHDYGSVDLNYHLGEEKGAYKDLLREITGNIFDEMGLPDTSIDEVLEQRAEYDGFSEEEINDKIVEMKDEDSEWWDNLDSSRRSDYKNKYTRAAVYRLYNGDEASRSYGGIDELAQLSSGIVRHFLELCSMSYYFEKDDSEAPLKSGITVKNQTYGAENLSEYHLVHIQQNVDRHGPELYQLVLDMGDILEEKLLNHTSEPEAAIIDIAEPNKIERGSDLYNILYKAEEHSVLLKTSNREPKSREQPLPETYHINRIYTPALDISPTYRWTTTFYPQDLELLLNKDKRVDTRDRLIRKLAMGDRDTHQQKLGQEYDSE